MFKSFTPGQESVFVKYPNYWADGEDGKPLPYVDEVVITDYTDETSLVNALISGVVDCIAPLTYVSIDLSSPPGRRRHLQRRILGAVHAADRRCPLQRGGCPPGVPAHGRPPSDARSGLRRLRIIGNDIFSIQDPEYDHAIPQREQDIEQAKFLLKKHGLERMTTTLITGPIFDGAVGAATVFAEQAAAAGVKVNLQQTPVTDYYGSELPEVGLRPGLVGSESLSRHGESGHVKGALNECHFANPRYNQLYGRPSPYLPARNRRKSSMRCA